MYQIIDSSNNIMLMIVHSVHTYENCYVGDSKAGQVRSQHRGGEARWRAARRGLCVPLRGARATAVVPRRGRASLSSCAKVVTCVTR